MAMRPTDPTYKLQGTILRETDKAIYMDVESINAAPLEPTETHWFPLSQIAQKFINEKEQGEDFILASEWICKAKELV